MMPFIPIVRVRDVDAAIAAAKAIGRPVALKVQSADILHKTEAGAVALNASTAEEVGAALKKAGALWGPYKTFRELSADKELDGIVEVPRIDPLAL